MLPLGSTYAAHPLACAASLACLEEYEYRGLIPHAARMGELLFEKLHELAGRHPRVGDVRGKGLLACLELVWDRKTHAAAGAGEHGFAAADANPSPGRGGRHSSAGPRQPDPVSPAADRPARTIDEAMAKLDRVLSWVDAFSD